MSTTTKSYTINKFGVRGIQGSQSQCWSGGCGSTVADFETDLKGNLYKIWNRMSSGSYFPAPVKAIAIPKTDGGERDLIWHLA